MALALCMLSACATAEINPATERRAVEAGLIPAVVIAGATAQPRSIEARMAHYRTPGLGIVVIRDGRIDWVGSYGLIDANESRRVEDDTPFQAASISKLVTANGALRMVDQKRLTLDGDVNAVLEDWSLPTSPGVPVTLRRLLSHTAGVNVAGFKGYAIDAPIPNLLQVLKGEPPANSAPVRAEDQTRAVRYSGGGYEVIELLMQQAADRPFPDLMKDLVLTPAGMTRSHFGPRRGRTDRAPAVGHGYDGGPVAGGGRIYPELAAAGLWSTPTDLARLAIAMIRDWRGGDVLLHETTLRTMLTPTDADMGLGAGVHGSGGEIHFDHAGWNSGFRAYLLAFPERGDGIVVMANADGADLLIDEIVRGAANVYGWPGFEPRRQTMLPLGVPSLDGLNGRYRLDAGFEIELKAVGDHLALGTPRGSNYTFYPVDRGLLVAVEDGAELALDETRAGVIGLWGMTGVRIVP